MKLYYAETRKMREKTRWGGEMSDLISKEKLRYDIAMLIMNNNSLIDTWLANCIDDVIDEQPINEVELQKAYEQGIKDTLDKYDETFRIASDIRCAMGYKTERECRELIRNGEIQRVKHGHWIWTGSCQVCSICDEEQYGVDTGRYYCPNCGAKMDEVEKL